MGSENSKSEKNANKSFTQNDSNPKSESLSETDVIKLFSQNDPKEEKSDLERLPKMILAKILEYLDDKMLARVWRLNRFFLMLLSDSNCANYLWKKKCEIYGDSLEKDIEEFSKDFQHSPFEKKLNDYCLLYKYFTDMRWDSIFLGKETLVSPDGKSFKNSNSGPWNCVVSEKPFNKGVHYLEVHFEHSTGFLFYGVCLREGLSKDGLLGEYFWTLDYDLRHCNKHCEQHKEIEKFGKINIGDTVGMIIDMENRTLTYLRGSKKYIGYTKLPDNVYVLASVGCGVAGTITKYIMGTNTIENYLSSRSILSKSYQTPKWLEEQKDFNHK